MFEDDAVPESVGPDAPVPPAPMVPEAEPGAAIPDEGQRGGTQGGRRGGADEALLKAAEPADRDEAATRDESEKSIGAVRSENPASSQDPVDPVDPVDPDVIDTTLPAPDPLLAALMDTARALVGADLVAALDPVQPFGQDVADLVEVVAQWSRTIAFFKQKLG